MKTNRSTFAILFYPNTSKTKKSGACPIVGRITVDGKNNHIQHRIGNNARQLG